VSAPVPDPGTRVGRAAERRSENTGLLIAFAVGLSVIVVLGVYGRIHAPTGFGVSLAGFPGGRAAKSALASGAFALALVQIFSALVMYGKFPSITAPSWIGTLHRWSGRGAVLLSVPVAVHCLYAFGFQSDEGARVLLHSMFGCFFYGAFVTKMLVLQRPKSPGWALPMLGGAVFTSLVTLWLTSSLWYYATA